MSHQCVARPAWTANDPIGNSSSEGPRVWQSLAAQPRRIIAARRLRAALFAENLFADPAWDILLELYASALEQQRHTIGSLGAAVPVPSTTMLRWLATLENEGLVERTADRLDARRIFVALTHNALAAMAEFFDALKGDRL